MSEGCSVVAVAIWLPLYSRWKPAALGFPELRAECVGANRLTSPLGPEKTTGAKEV